MSPLAIIDLPLPGLKRMELKRLADDRGYLARLFCAEALASAAWIKPIAQINYTYTAKRGVVRGMHFQRPPHAEMKLIHCTQGELWDVVVDLRVGSPTFLRWHAERLSADNACALLIPEGFAHGFQALTDDVELLYFHTEAYNAQAEDGLNPTDPRLGIRWPLAIAKISARDAGHALLAPDFEGVRI